MLRHIGSFVNTIHDCSHHKGALVKGVELPQQHILIGEARTLVIVRLLSVKGGRSNLHNGDVGPRPLSVDLPISSVIRRGRQGGCIQILPESISGPLTPLSLLSPMRRLNIRALTSANGSCL